MSKENYRRLGDYIREVDVRNRDLEVKLSQGISNEKYFQQPKQVAINPYNDKIVRKGQFAFNRATTRNGNKISIAYREEEDCTVSASYCVFDVKNEDILSPKYLMMWFRRPEFDRYAIYHSHGSAHEYFTFENMCDVELPIPSIEQQRKIVAEYETISRRIRLNEQMITRLEETAQTLYRKMFVDGIDKENLSEGWRIRTLGDVAHILDYKRKPLSAEQRALIKGKYPYFGAMSIIDYIDDYIFDGVYLLFAEDGVNVVDEDGHPNLQYVYGKFWLNNHAHIMQGNDIVSTEYLYLALKESIVIHLVTGAAQPKINQENMSTIPIIVPPQIVMQQFNQKICLIFNYKKLKETENIELIRLQSLLLAKMRQ
ncbi:restriction endonuclease subunit S [Phocaeicola plebeius]|jgi:type I restriction enzyme S subunit